MKVIIRESDIDDVFDSVYSTITSNVPKNPGKYLG